MTLVDLLLDRAAAGPDRPAYQFASDVDGAPWPALSYGALARRAQAVAAVLADRGLRGERVLLLFPPGLDYVVGFLGCVLAGAIAVPTYLPTGRTIARQLALIADAAPAAILTCTQVAVMAAPVRAAAPLLEALPWIDATAIDDAAAAQWRHPGVGPDDVVFLQYTSGSTSTPRGVVLDHRCLLANLEQIHRCFGTGPDTDSVIWLPPYHDMGLIGGILETIYAGYHTTLMSPVAFIQRPRRWLEVMSQTRAHISGGPNFAYELIARKVTDEQLEGLDLSAWSVAFDGAEPVRTSTLDRFADRVARCGFDRRALFPCYGLAEATLLVAGGRAFGGLVRTQVSSAALCEGRLEPAAGGVELVGYAVEPGTELAVVTDRRRVGDGQVGELWVSGPSVAAGYWRRPEHAAFGQRLDGDDRAWLATGDLGAVVDGTLYVTGRAKDLLIVRGRNHYPHDLELTAERAHASVRPGCVAAFAAGDDDDEIVIAAEVDRASAPEQRAGIVAAVRAAIAAEHGVAVGAVVLVGAGRLAKTSSGKVQRHAARDAWTSGWSDALVVDVRVADEPAPPTAVGRLVAAALGLDGPVPADQPLVALGLDSLGAVELRAALRTALGVDVALTALLDGATVVTLEALVATAPDAAVSVTGDGGAAGPATAGQRAMWFLEQLRPGAATQHIASAARLDDHTDLDALGSAVVALAARHPALRTRFAGDGGTVEQIVEAAPRLALEVVDARAWDAAAISAALDELAARPFALDQAPLARVAVVDGGPGRRYLAITIHHIVADLWSLAVALDELGALYGGAVTLPPPPAIDARDLARAELALLAARGDQLTAWWRAELDGAALAHHLPTDRARPPAPAHAGDTVAFTLPPALVAQVAAVAAAHDTTPFVVLLAAFEALVHRLGAGDDFLIGVPTAGRDDPASHGVVTYGVNPVPIRAQLAAGQSFAALIGVVRARVLGALDHQALPLPVLVERLGVPRDPSRSPLFQLMFSVQRAPRLDARLGAFAVGRGGVSMRLGGLGLESLEQTRRTAPVDLMLVMAEHDGALDAALTYDTALFDRATVDAIAARYRLLLADALAEPARAVDRLAVLVAGERPALIAAGAGPSTRYDLTALAAQVEAVVDRVPDAVAIVDSAAGVILSYAELDARACRVARSLAAAGVREGARVGLRIPRGVDHVIATLAIVKLGASYVPLDPGHPVERLRQIAVDAGLVAVIEDAESGAELGVPRVELAAALAHPDDRRVVTAVGAGDELYVMYTSGSTGQPKGIAIPHGAVARLVLDTDYVDLGPGARLGHAANPAFDAATFEIWGALLTGATLVVLDRATLLAPIEMAARLRADRVTTLFVTTALFNQVVGEVPGAFATLADLMFGGEAVDPRRVASCLAAGAPRRLLHVYGPTESTTFASWHRVEAVAAGASTVPIGGPIARTTLHVLDEHLEPVPAGVLGELFVGGDGLAHGYVDDAAATAARFVPDPFGAPGSRLYRTGDLVRRPAGRAIEFVGRRDFQVKLRGFRIELGEIEVALRRHPGVADALVVVAGDGADRFLAAYVAGAAVPAATALRDHLAARMPDYMIPAVFVGLERLPVTANGKLDRRALPPARRGVDGARATGASPVEARLLAIWTELLGGGEIGVDDDFFAVGGHSLLATRLAARIREAWAITFPVGDVFTHPTVAAQARHIGAAVPADAPAGAPPRARTGRRVLLSDLKKPSSF